MNTKHHDSTRRDQGHTLIEIAVAIFLLAIFGAITASVTTNAAHVTQDTTRRVTTQGHLNDGIARIARDVKTTSGLVVASPTEMVLSYADPGTGVCTHYIRYQVTGDILVSDRSTGCTTEDTWTLAVPVVEDLDPAVAPFAYNSGGPDAFGNPETPSSVERVDVHLTVGRQALATSATLRRIDAPVLVEAPGEATP